MVIGFGCDHVGVELKGVLMARAAELGHECRDYGCGACERSDYPVYGFLVGQAVAAGECALGVVVCGTGAGISISANKVKGVRAVACSEPYTARMARMHNDANVLGVGARVVGSEVAKMILEEFLTASPEGGRHAARVDMIREIETTGGLAAAREAR